MRPRRSTNCVPSWSASCEPPPGGGGGHGGGPFTPSFPPSHPRQPGPLPLGANTPAVVCLVCFFQLGQTHLVLLTRRRLTPPWNRSTSSQAKDFLGGTRGEIVAFVFALTSASDRCTLCQSFLLFFKSFFFFSKEKLSTNFYSLELVHLWLLISFSFLRTDSGTAQTSWFFMLFF